MSSKRTEPRTSRQALANGTAWHDARLPPDGESGKGGGATASPMRGSMLTSGIFRQHRSRLMELAEPKDCTLEALASTRAEELLEAAADWHQVEFDRAAAAADKSRDFIRTRTTVRRAFGPSSRRKRRPGAGRSSSVDTGRHRAPLASPRARASGRASSLIRSSARKRQTASSGMRGSDGFATGSVLDKRQRRSAALSATSPLRLAATMPERGGGAGLGWKADAQHRRAASTVLAGMERAESRLGRAEFGMASQRATDRSRAVVDRQEMRRSVPRVSITATDARHLASARSPHSPLRMSRSDAMGTSLVRASGS